MSTRGRPRKPECERRGERVDSYFPSFLYEAMEEECQKMGQMSHSQFITMAVAQYLEKKNNSQQMA